MSSHREAPEISKDPVVDSTDVYAFVSPDKPDLVTLIANYIPFQDPAGGPNFFEFADDAAYRINVNNSDGAGPDIVFEFRFTTKVTNPNTFLYNTGPVKSLTDPNLNRRQTYTLTKTTKNQSQVLVKNAPVVPCNVGPRSMPDYTALATSSIQRLPKNTSVFVGQRTDPFFVDVGSIFDLGVLRPFQNLHLIPLPAAAGVNSLRGFNVHTLAIELPITSLTVNQNKPGVSSRNAVIGVWTSAYRYKASVRGAADRSLSSSQTGPFTQVSRLGNPLINEAIIPMSRKDEWNKSTPQQDANFAKYGLQPELAKLLNVLYPGVFPKLAAYTKNRADLAAILFTGIPSGVVPGFQNFTGPTIADMLRLNVAIPPSSVAQPPRPRRRRSGRVPERSQRSPTMW